MGVFDFASPASTLKHLCCRFEDLRVVVGAVVRFQVRPPSSSEAGTPTGGTPYMGVYITPQPQGLSLFLFCWPEQEKSWLRFVLSFSQRHPHMRCQGGHSQATV